MPVEESNTTQPPAHKLQHNILHQCTYCSVDINIIVIHTPENVQYTVGLSRLASNDWSLQNKAPLLTEDTTRIRPKIKQL